MKRYIAFSIIALLAFSHGSFAQGDYYFPDKVNSPGLQKAGEGKLTLSFKPSVKFLDFPEHLFIINPAIDLAYSPAEHLAITAAYRSIIRRPGTDGAALPGWDNSNIEYYGNRFELGAGYYTSFGGNGTFEAFGAYSYGNLNRYGGVYQPDYNYYSGLNSYNIYHNSDFRSTYHSFMLHMAAGVAKKYVSFRGGMKFTFQYLTDFRYRNPSIDTLLPVGSRSADMKNEGFTFIQPYIDMEAGGKRIRFNFQAGLSQQMLDWAAFQGDVRAYISLGVVVRIGAKKV
ncbi:MAG TPA: hypothetical protein VEB40_04525 [Flavipsychrobacter sp.]|nr:hypothetical protein [Flavipsychrobacter sp.]